MGEPDFIVAPAATDTELSDEAIAALARLLCDWAEQTEERAHAPDA